MTPARPVGLAPWPWWSWAAQQAALRRLTRDSFRGVATVLGVGVGRLRRRVDIPGPPDDDSWWAYPGDVVFSTDEASFRDQTCASFNPSPHGIARPATP